MTDQEQSDEREVIEQNHPRIRSLVHPWLLNSLLPVSFFGALACPFLAVWLQKWFQDDLPRYLFCTTFAVCLAVLCFLLYPAEHSTKMLVPGLGVPLDVAGPVAVFIVSLGVVWFFMPRVASGNLLEAKYDTGVPKLSWKNLDIKSDDTFDWYFVPDKADPDFLYGVFVKFDGGSKYSAKLVSELRPDYPVEFVRGEDKFAVKQPRDQQ